MTSFKISYLILIFCFVSLTSCSDDEFEPAQSYAEKLIGEWNQTKVFLPLEDTSESIQAYDWFDVEEGINLKLNDDLTFYLSVYENCTSGTYEVENQFTRLVLIFDCEVIINDTTFNQLTYTVTPDDSVQNFLLLNLRGKDAFEEGPLMMLSRVN